MREKTNANGAGGAMSERGCERGEQLVAYLYGESAPSEAEEFRRHVANCAVCGEELAAFGGVREGLAEWREEVVRSMPPLNVNDSLATAANVGARSVEVSSSAADVVAHAAHARERTRSAAAALREFFSLSPMWLRFGTAAAALAFCAMAAFTLARAEVRWDSNGFALNTGVVKERVVEKQIQASAPNGFTQEKVDALIRQNVEREVAAAQERWKAEEAERAGAVNAGVINASGERRSSTSRNASGEAASKSQRGSRRSPRGGSRNELLADNDDVFYPGEESVPRLTDILGAVKTQGKENER
jgi:hypothetical protein